MSEIVIGKHTLESLTTGMYSDPFVVFREYIQNSVDSIDIAFSEGLLHTGEEQIYIAIDSFEGTITITDNGTGITQCDVEKTLISIGNSQKSSDNSRGFRGIGRLSALSYCLKLTFETSFRGEKYGTKIEMDANKLAELLSSNQKDNLTVERVLEKIYTVSTYCEEESKHYFKVEMSGVDKASGLLNFSEIISYLSQNAPVPYHPDFSWGKEIVKRLKSHGYSEPIYNLYVECGNQKEQVFKPYRDTFTVDKSKNIIDKIKDISIIQTKNPQGEISAFGWIAKSNYLGSVYEKTIKGLRVRKGNILIGDSQTLNTVFKDARFNGWTIGEIYAIDSKLIPNARRDNFEKNQDYFMLNEQLSALAVAITKEIRSASLKRNAELSRSISDTANLKETANEAIENGVSSSQKQLISHKIAKIKNTLSQTSVEGEIGLLDQEHAFEELDILLGNVHGATSYKALNLSGKLTTTEKKILEKVFNVLNNSLENSDEIIDKILLEFP